MLANFDYPGTESVYCAKFLVLAATLADRERIETTILEAGHWVRRALAFNHALDWIEAGCDADAFFVEVPPKLDSETEKVLISAARQSARHATPLIVSTPLSLLDVVDARSSGPYTSVLCEPDQAEQIAAIALGGSGSGDWLSDISTEMDSQRLRRLADEVSRIARALSNLSGGTRPEGGYAAGALADVQLGFTAQPVFVDQPSAHPAPEEIRRILRLRRLRDQYFDPSLFADPAWDMLLDLLAARLEHAQVAVSSLCIAAAVPPTTALRWIKAMTDHGLFERCADPEDGRRIFIRLSDRAMQGMGRYFEAMKKAGGFVI